MSHLGGGTNIWQWWGERITPPIFTVFGPVGVDWDVTPPPKILISRKKLIKKYQTAPKRGGGEGGRGAKKN